MSQLLFDTLPIDLLIDKSKYYLNKKYEYVFSTLSDDIRKIFNNESYSNLEIKSKNLQIKDSPISWYCLNVLQSLSIDNPTEKRKDFIIEVLKQTDLGGNNIDFKTHEFESNGFKFNIPINLNEKLNLDFGNSTFQSIEEYDKWENSFIKAIELVRSINPNILKELNLLVKNILVIKSSNGSHGSMSPKSLIGTIYLPDVEDATLIAECLVHECLHQYLYRIEFAGPLFLNNEGLEELYYSPWKDNPRPLIMVLHGAFVFSGVVMFYNELIKKELPKKHLNKFKERIIYRNSQIRIALNVLKHNNKATELGKKIIQILDEQLEELNYSNILEGDIQIDDVLDHFNNFSSKDFKHVSIK